ncbi:hypothetical protein WJ23_17420 [Burkholderia lata]|nr:hypothetical protein WJ23_17420 [Burkholderia lata]
MLALVLMLVLMLAPRITIARMTMPPLVALPVAMAVPVAVAVHADLDRYTGPRGGRSLFDPRWRCTVALREGRAGRGECTACHEGRQNSTRCNCQGFHRAVLH